MTTVMARATFPALGTNAIVVVTDDRQLDDAVEASRQQIDAIDRACSRFRSDSDLERVNDANGRETEVGPDLLSALDVALDAASSTDGDVDPTIGEALRVLGYDCDFASVAPSGRTVVRVAKVSGWRSVTVDRARHTVQLPRNVRLDLGATAKALAADRCALAAAGAAGCGVLVSLGGDISVSGVAPADGWPIQIADWHGGDAGLAHDAALDGAHPIVSITEGGLATSSTTVRRWTRGHEAIHHIVDPSTGRSSDVAWKTVSVAAASCVEANVATTLSIVRGERAIAWLDAKSLAARLVRPNGDVIVVGGWPADHQGDDSR